LTAVETAFSDLHRRYEKLKGVVENFKKVMLCLGTSGSQRLENSAEPSVWTITSE